MDRAPHAIAAVIVPDLRLLSLWLGNRPLVQWSLDKLAEVRGLDFVCVVVPPRHKGAAGPPLGVDGAAVVTAPASLNLRDDYATARWLLYESNLPEGLKTERLLVVRADQPFTPRERIALIFGNPGRDVCLAVRPVTCIDNKFGEIPSAELTRGAWACHRGFLKPERPQWGSHFVAVPVSSVEALSVLEPDGEVACRALASQGCYS